MAAADFNPVLALLILLLLGSLLQAVAYIGVNWGILSTHRLSPPIVVDLLKENRIGKVKLFDTDPSILRDPERNAGTSLLLSCCCELLGLPECLEIRG
ncbi:hypothetical protein KFK09_026707 [Dendrobium nobile]|uniref:Uncharacterized protein n=1 Tax=Dendrobium nobile TaxID=94219 RepID=A0A8T3ADP4_DENNO|nr:hypothetical protein KFK09_026707 [Dendrobium nobile]